MKLENVKVYFSIIASSVIVYGLVFNVYLYSKFNIDITSYIDLGESLLLFLPTLPTILFILIPAIFAIDVLLPYSILRDPIENHFFYGRLFDGNLKNKKVVIWMFIFFVIVAFILIIVADIYDYIFATTAYIIVICNLIMFFPPLLRLGYDYVLKKGKQLPVIAPIIFYLVIFILIGTLYTAQRREFRILEGRRNPNVRVILKNKAQIQTDTTIRYVGKTKNYIFLYDRFSKSAITIPLTEIGEIRFGSNY